jgi:uncharacterized protein (UPF0333 family)
VTAFISSGSRGGVSKGFSVIALAVVILIVGLLLGSSFNDIVYAIDTILAVKC